MKKELTKTDDYRPARDCIGCKYFTPADYISIKPVPWVGLCNKYGFTKGLGFKLNKKYVNELLKCGKALCYIK